MQVKGLRQYLEELPLRTGWRQCLSMKARARKWPRWQFVKQATISVRHYLNHVGTLPCPLSLKARVLRCSAKKFMRYYGCCEGFTYHTTTVPRHLFLNRSPVGWWNTTSWINFSLRRQNRGRRSAIVRIANWFPAQCMCLAGQTTSMTARTGL